MPAATPEILICGLGVGFALAEAVSQARVARVDVVEISAEIIGWHGTHLRHLAAPAWEDGRVHVINADVVAWLARRRGPYDVICLDVDNGPEWTVWDANQALYGDEGLRRVRDSLRPGGVVSVWSAAEAPGLRGLPVASFRRRPRVPGAGEPRPARCRLPGKTRTLRRVITGDLDRALATAIGSAGTWRPAPPGTVCEVRTYVTTIAFWLARGHAGGPGAPAAPPPSRPGWPRGSAGWTGWKRRP